MTHRSVREVLGDYGSIVSDAWWIGVQEMRRRLRTWPF